MKYGKETRSMGYNYPNDGKLHFRYHDLLKCTPGSIKRLVLERYGEIPVFNGEHTQFGTDRHEMFEEEMRGTGRLPKVFLDQCSTLPSHYKGVQIDHVEEEFATEIFDGVVLHSRPDAVSTSYGLIADPKVTVDQIKKWNPSRQLMMYTLHFQARDIKIKELCYLGEIWDYTVEERYGKSFKVKKDIIDYQCLIKEVFMSEVMEIKNQWAKPRIELLQAALELYKEGIL